LKNIFLGEILKSNNFCITFAQNFNKMKLKTLLIIGIISLFTIGCKNEKTSESLEVVAPETKDNIFRVTLKVIASKDDDFALFYTEDGSINFFDVKPVWQGVKGSETEQEVMFQLPDGVYPTQLRFDLGLNKDQSDIIIKGVKFSYNDKEFVANGAEFFNYFRADENQCTADPLTGVIKANVVNGERKGPSLYPHQDILGAKLPELAQ
jgi:hypothetical protein